MQKITHTYLLGLKATGEIQRVPCGDALELRVSKTGKKSWYLRYDTMTPEGKRKQNIVTLGDFPVMGLKEARVEAESRKIQAKTENLNLVAAKKVERLEKAQVAQTFQEVCDDWLELKCKEWTSEKSKKQNRGRLAANIYPVLGHMPMDTITVAHIEQALLNVIGRGSMEVARRIHTMIAEIFSYAFSKGIVKDADIIVRLGIYKKSMPKRKKKKSHFEREMELDEIGALALKIHEHSAGTLPVVTALKLAPYLAARPSELIEAEWSEIDLERAEWRIPAERMKMGHEHLVPLPRQAVKLLEKMKKFSGRSRYVFPSTSSVRVGKPATTMALIQALRRMGFTQENGNRFVTHGFRGLFSTIAYNHLGAREMAVELQLAHLEKDDVKSAYHKTGLRTVIDERRALLQRYADFLDDLREKAKD